MKIGRNQPCPCGSGKKYKRCCMSNTDAAPNSSGITGPATSTINNPITSSITSPITAALADEMKQVTAMNPNLSLDELNAVLDQRVTAQNHRPVDDFCGLSPEQMSNWLREPLEQLTGVVISTPSDLSTSPVMSYLALLLEHACANSGRFKATAKGNLPAVLVKKASALLPTFAVAKYEKDLSISDYSGSNEDKFNALHYTKVLAEMTGIIEPINGYYTITDAAQKQYLENGIQAFFKPMLSTAVGDYNWGYLDAFEHKLDLSVFWVFMLWRLQKHGNLDQLQDELLTAFPAILQELTAVEYNTREESLKGLVEYRFIKRFLEYWGFIIVDPLRYQEGQVISRTAEAQPLLAASFEFSV